MQSTDTVLMIEPIAFEFNAQTAVDNYFQVNDGSKETQSRALKEFSAFVEKLRSKGVNFITVKDTPHPHTPDSIFPNNWVSFHNDGNVVLYPMFAENRRPERRDDILQQLRDEGYKIANVIDYSTFEAKNKFLEGTGSMILDNENKIAYGAVSIRLDEELFEKWCKEFGYQPVVFHSFQSVNGERLPIYHSNVMICIASEFAIVGLDPIDNEEEKAFVKKTLIESHKEIIEITEEQVQNFAGNMLEVRNDKGKRFLVMSETAYRSLTAKQIHAIEEHVEIIYTNLQTIEKNGGGGARCMMAEVFLPKV